MAEGCGNRHKVSDGCGCLPTEKELAKIWNDGQKPSKEERQQSKCRRLKAENKELKRQLAVLQNSTAKIPGNNFSRSSL